MKFEEDYTEEDWNIINERKTTMMRQQKREETAKGKSRGRNLVTERVMRWQKEHIEHVRAYNSALKKRRYHERGGNPPPTEKTINKVGINKQRKKLRYRSERNRITKQKLIDLLMEEEKRRADQLLDEIEHGKRKKIIMCIVGGSGSGKTLASLHLRYKLGANVICSYTTRPPRDDEEEGRDHHFVDIVPPSDFLLAFTVFGNYKYYALKSQVIGPVTVYVIDEKGLIDLREKFSNEYDIRAVYIKRSSVLKRIAGVTQNRIDRDGKRKELIPEDSYDLVVENNETKAKFFDIMEIYYKGLVEEAKEYGW